MNQFLQDISYLIFPKAPSLAAGLLGPNAEAALRALAQALRDAGQPVMDNADARDLYTVLNANRSLIGGALAPAEAYWRTTYPRTAATECDPCEEIRNHGFTLRMLAYGVSVGFFLLIYLLLFAQRQLSSEFRDLLLTMTGVVGTGWASIISFYFGSSVGSRTQNATLSTIAAQAGAKPPPPDGAKS